MNRFLFLTFVFSFGILLAAEIKPKSTCNSLTDCEEKAGSTEIHRKKISLLSFGISEYASSATIRDLIPLYLKRVKSIILEANGETGYKGEIVLKVTHKPEYKMTQLKKAEEDISFLEANQNYLSKEESKELENLKVLLGESK